MVEQVTGLLFAMYEREGLSYENWVNNKRKKEKKREK